MSTALPDGLLSICCKKTPISTDDDHRETRFLHYWSLAQFWKVSSVRNKFTNSPATVRAENIFWRLWNDPIHRESVDETGITQICDLCTQPINLAPFESSMPSKVGPQEPVPFHCMKNQTHQLDALRATRSDFSSGRDIVFKPHFDKDVDNDQLHISATNIEPHNSESSAVDRPKASRSTSSRNSSTRTNVNPRDRSMTAATTATKSKRPALGRRKTSSTAPQVARPLKSPALSTRQGRQSEVASAAHEHETPFELPSASSWEDEPSNSGSLPRKTMAQPIEQVELDIDPDFRNKFAEKVASSSSLALAGRMRKTGSIVRFATTPDHEPFEGIRDEDNDDGQSSLPRRHTERPPLFHRHSTSSVAVMDGEEEEDDDDDDDDEELSPKIPRTRSQLSFLISERRATEGEDSLKVQHEHLDQGKHRNHPKKSEDDEVLAMAQRQGVTKAGGIQVPRSHRVDQDIESRYSSPDRDLTF